MIEAKKFTPLPTDSIICVRIGKIQRENIYEMTRKFWRVNLKRAKNAQYLIGVLDGHVEIVIEIDGCFRTENTLYEGRCEFTGRVVSDSQYLDTDASAVFAGMQTPVRYINC